MKTSSLLAAISLIAVLATSAVASEQVPFRGSLAAVQSGEVIGGFLIVEGSGTGRATELGRFAVTFHEEVDLSTGIGTGTFTFVAANGDTLSSSFIGNATPTPDPKYPPAGGGRYYHRRDGTVRWRDRDLYPRTRVKPEQRRFRRLV